MSKISEQKALEAYPREIKWIGNQWSGSPEDINIEKRYGYIIGYDQAFKDFMEKACEWLKSYRQETLDKTGYIAGIVNDEAIEQFKKYMQNE